ncbi:MAG: ATP-binding protein [Caulobacteraceae bacterium]
MAALAVTALSWACALAPRVLTLGWEQGIGLSSTFFPAFIVASLYGGARWGWISVAVTMVIAMTIGPQNNVFNLPQQTVTAMFFVSAGVTVMVAGALRSTIVRLAETQQDRDRALFLITESEARFRDLANTAPALMWISAPDSKRAFVNEAYMTFTGLSREAAEALDWRDMLHPDDDKRIRIEESIGADMGRVFILEARYRRADGAYRWLHSISQPRYTEIGELTGYVGIAFDVSDAKKAEQDLQHINDLLRERVEAAIAERDQVQAALAQSQKMEALGRLTGGVAHDFNNLLTVMIGSLDMMKRHPDDRERRGRLTDAALTSARRAERLTSQLLAFSRRQPARDSICEVDAAITEIEPILRRAIGEDREFEIVLGAAHAASRLDASQLEACLLNLLVNAKDATGINGRVDLETGIVRLDQAEGELPSGDYISVCVRDNGAGMDGATLAHVFEPFFTTKDVGKGTGLGLAQVYGFARQSGGSVHADSTPGQGTTVRILLPLTSLRADEALEAPTPVVRTARKLHVLLVEDEPAVGDMAEDLLRELGHSVRRADGVTAALAILAEDVGVNFVLTDIIMPGGQSGIDLADTLERERPDLPVLLTSGFTGRPEGEALRRPFLPKPYAVSELSRMLQQTLAGAARENVTIEGV